MKSFLSTIAITLLSVVPVVLGLTVNTPPSVVQCQPALFSWSGGVPPYFLSLLPPAQPSAPAIKQFSPQNGLSYTWVVDIAGGQAFSISLADSTGTIAYSQVVNIQMSSDASCVNTTVVETGASTPTSGTVAVTSSATSTGTSASKTGTSTASSSTTTSTGKPNGAARTGSGLVEIAVILGVVGAVLL